MNFLFSIQGRHILTLRIFTNPRFGLPLSLPRYIHPSWRCFSVCPFLPAASCFLHLSHSWAILLLVLLKLLKDMTLVCLVRFLISSKMCFCLRFHCLLCSSENRKAPLHWAIKTAFFKGKNPFLPFLSKKIYPTLLGSSILRFTSSSPLLHSSGATTF